MATMQRVVPIVRYWTLLDGSPISRHPLLGQPGYHQEDHGLGNDLVQDPYH